MFQHVWVGSESEGKWKEFELYGLAIGVSGGTGI